MGLSKALAKECREKLPEAQGGRCALCGEPLGPRKGRHAEGRGWGLDHVWPRARFQYYNRGNLVAAHHECNEAKDDRDPTGCEVIMLAVVNLRLGWSLRPLPAEELERRDLQRGGKAWRPARPASPAPPREPIRLTSDDVLACLTSPAHVLAVMGLADG